MDKKSIQKRIDEILTKCETEKRNMTDAEEVELAGLEVKGKQL